jgi:hypothetical protein
MVDWSTVSSLATAGGTLVLALATFSSVRSANRMARTTERTFLVGLRPVLFPSRASDPPQQIRWGDSHWAQLEGGRASIEHVDGIVYLAMSLRNVGAGIAVLHGWRAGTDDRVRQETTHPPADAFQPQARDLYVPSGDPSFWQAAIRDADHPERDGVVRGIAEDGALIIDVLYSDHEGGQPTISRFSVVRPASGGTSWLCSVIRHWSLDRENPHRRPPPVATR